MIMKGSIGFKNHRIRCILGDLPEERITHQDIFVDLKVVADFTLSSISDNLKDTIDYVELANICTSLAQEKQYNLMETFASDVVKIVIDRFPVETVWIRIKKPMGLPTAEFSTIELQM